jgi:hypothetical protein
MMKTDWGHEARKLSILGGRCLALREEDMSPPQIRQGITKRNAHDERIVEVDGQHRG